MDVVFFSGKTENTKYFVDRLDIKSKKIEIEKNLIVNHPYFLIVPTYASPDGSKSTPKPVIKFLKENSGLMRGVIGSGNINFGELYCWAAHVISRKFLVPILHKFELRGNENDKEKIERIVNELYLN